MGLVAVQKRLFNITRRMGKKTYIVLKTSRNKRFERRSYDYSSKITCQKRIRE